MSKIFIRGTAVLLVVSLLADPTLAAVPPRPAVFKSPTPACATLYREQAFNLPAALHPRSLLNHKTCLVVLGLGAAVAWSLMHPMQDAGHAAELTASLGGVLGLRWLGEVLRGMRRWLGGASRATPIADRSVLKPAVPDMVPEQKDSSKTQGGVWAWVPYEWMFGSGWGGRALAPGLIESAAVVLVVKGVSWGLGIPMTMTWSIGLTILLVQGILWHVGHFFDKRGRFLPRVEAFVGSSGERLGISLLGLFLFKSATTMFRPDASQFESGWELLFWLWLSLSLVHTGINTKFQAARSTPEPRATTWKQLIFRISLPIIFVAGLLWGWPSPAPVVPPADPLTAEDPAPPEWKDERSFYFTESGEPAIFEALLPGLEFPMSKNSLKKYVSGYTVIRLYRVEQGVQTYSRLSLYDTLNIRIEKVDSPGMIDVTGSDGKTIRRFPIVHGNPQVLSLPASEVETWSDNGRFLTSRPEVYIDFGAYSFKGKHKMNDQPLRVDFAGIDFVRKKPPAPAPLANPEKPKTTNFLRRFLPFMAPVLMLGVAWGLSHVLAGSVHPNAVSVSLAGLGVLGFPRQSRRTPHDPLSIPRHLLQAA